MSFINISEIQAKEIAPGFFGKFLHSPTMSIAYWEAKQGAEIPIHQHVHEMIVNVIEGELELTVGEETRVLRFGEVAFIPGLVPHKAKALTDCKIIDVFHPVREDYR